ncbi:mevalonate kinase [Caviibacter abscessus]|uniref:mevalonate kinase n=1 Tax=Caviibacter abscessus TaxID=1766719 RepID=UPI00083973B5|nr:mevalonate kinase [Caviibacter abscessus]
MSAHAKVILFGEHSVVYGKKAIAMPLYDLSISVKIVKEYIEENEHVKFIKEYIMNKYNMPEFFIRINSTIPISKGLGSSAALALAIAREVKKINDNIDIYDVVLESEKKAHKNPSGIDSTVVSGKNSIIFEKNKGITNIDISLNAYLVIFDSNISGSTKVAVEHVKNTGRMDIIEKLGDISERAIKYICEKNIYEIGKLFNKSQKLLKELGLSNNYIDYMIKNINYHSLGAKITGSGMGGCVIALCENSKKVSQLLKQMSKKGVKLVCVAKI